MLVRNGLQGDHRNTSNSLYELVIYGPVKEDLPQVAVSADHEALVTASNKAVQSSSCLVDCMAVVKEHQTGAHGSSGTKPALCRGLEALQLERHQQRGEYKGTPRGGAAARDGGAVEGLC